MLAARAYRLMGKIVIQEWMSLDGVVQSPAYPDEDPSDGFEHGGWHLPYFDDASFAWVEQNITGAGGFLFGRRTYDAFAKYWPMSEAEPERRVAEALNSKPKYVATTRKEPLTWRNSHRLEDDALDAIAALRREEGEPLLVFGSTTLVPKLLARGLVDELRLMIDPLVLGNGKRIFTATGTRAPLRLLESRPTSTGALLCTYAVAAEDGA